MPANTTATPLDGRRLSRDQVSPTPSDGLEFNLEGDLVGALRGGLPELHSAACSAGLDGGCVDAVVGAAWDPCSEFSAVEVEGFPGVVTLAVDVNGWGWANAMLVDPRPREESFRGVVVQARSWADKWFPRLPQAERQAAADDAMLLLSRRLLDDPRCGFRTPAWTSQTVVRRNVKWRLLDAAEEFDAILDLSLDDYWAAFGEHAISGIDYGSGAVDDRGVETVVWASALRLLTDQAPGMLARKRSGAVRDRLALTIQAAGWVLERGSADGRGRDGEGRAEVTRHQFAQDGLLVCFHGLRAVAPRTWGAFPAQAVPTRAVIARVAQQAVERGDVNASWFARQEARRVDVAKGDRLLHGVRNLVEALVREAAHGE
ncbi:MAG: hypothetical protein MUF09_09775 [Candidatus Nanopelagicales bacterium]|jgi:hypothetical protein|nr:hypothetical protein [Candidatus Nanopelagicales bacterium]